MATTTERQKFYSGFMPLNKGCERLKSYEDVLKQGIDIGFAKAFSGVHELIEGRVKRTIIAVEQICSQIKTNLNFTAIEAYYNLTNPIHHDVIILIPEDDHRSENFYEAYGIANQVTSEIIEPDFYISIGFIAKSNNINYELLNADGYKYRQPFETDTCCAQ